MKTITIFFLSTSLFIGCSFKSKLKPEYENHSIKNASITVIGLENTRFGPDDRSTQGEDFAFELLSLATGIDLSNEPEITQKQINQASSVFYEELQKLADKNGHQLIKSEMNSFELNGEEITESIVLNELSGEHAHQDDHVEFNKKRNEPQSVTFKLPSMEQRQELLKQSSYLLLINKNVFDANIFVSLRDRDNYTRYWANHFIYLFYDLENEKIISLNYSLAQMKDEGSNFFTDDSFAGKKWRKVAMMNATFFVHAMKLNK